MWLNCQVPEIYETADLWQIICNLSLNETTCWACDKSKFLKLLLQIAISAFWQYGNMFILTQALIVRSLEHLRMAAISSKLKPCSVQWLWGLLKRKTLYKMKCDTSSNDTSSNEPFRLKVTSSKWHFVDCAHCRKTRSSNSFDEKKESYLSNG